MAKKTVKKKPAKKAVKKKMALKNKSNKKPVLNKKEQVKKTVKKTVKSAWDSLPKSYTTPLNLFDEWYSKFASKKIEKIEKEWIKDNEPNDPNEDGGGDHWCVNEMMHNGDAHEMTAEIAERVFIKGYNKEKWELTMGDSLFCDLDAIIEMAYEAGKKARS